MSKNHVGQVLTQMAEETVTNKLEEFGVSFTNILVPVHESFDKPENTE